MKNIFKYAWAAVLVCFTLFSCNDDDIEIIEFDDSYTPEDPIKGDRDDLPPINLLDTYVYFKDLQGEQSIVKKLKDDVISIKSAEPVEIIINLNKGAEEKLNYELVVDEEYLSEKGLKVLPTGTYNFNFDKTFEVDEKSDEVKIEFNPENLKNVEDGEYALALKTSFVNEDVKHLSDYDMYVLTISIRTSFIPNGDNIDNNHTDSSINGNTFNKDVTFSAKVNSDNIYSLNNESTNDYYTWKGSSDEVLTAEFPEQREIIGVIFYTYYWNNYDYYKALSLKEVKVEVAADDDEFIEQGTLVDNTYNMDKVYLKFKNPIDIKKIRFSEFKSHQSDQGNPGFKEIQFIYAN